MEEQQTPPTLDPLAQLTAQCEEYLAGWKRARADYENVMKQAAQNRDDDRRRVRAQLAETLLPIMDNFGYVLKHVPDVGGCSAEFQKAFAMWQEGIAHVDRQFTEALANIGVVPIPAIGTSFDPLFHEAVESRAAADTPEGTILEEVTRGWKLGDTVLRPAKVIVSS